jgi:hypothetical protein
MMIKKKKKNPDDPLEFCLGHELRLKITGLEFCLVFPLATYFLLSGNFLSSILRSSWFFMHFFIFHMDKNAETNHKCVTGRVLNTRRLVVNFILQPSPTCRK